MNTETPGFDTEPDLRPRNSFGGLGTAFAVAAIVVPVTIPLLGIFNEGGLSDDAREKLGMFGWGFGILALIVFLVRVPAMVSARSLKTQFGAANVYPIGKSKTLTAGIDAARDSGVLSQGSLLTLYMTAVASSSGLALWPTKRQAEPWTIGWSDVSRVEMGSVVDGARTYPTVSIVTSDPGSTTVALLVIGRGPFGAFGESGRRVALIIHRLNKLRDAAHSGPGV